MNGPSPSIGSLSIGYRALAVLVSGIQFFAVGALLFEIILGVRFPGLRSFPHSLGVSALLLLTGFLCGLGVDGTATKLWNFMARRGRFAFDRGGDSESALEHWMAKRSDYHRYPEVQGLEAWLVAQQWFWRSPRAAAEAGDLRLRLMLGKDSALNAALAWLLTLVALMVIPLRAGPGDPQASMWTLGGVASLTGVMLFWSLWGTMVRPEIEQPLLRLRRWWFWALLAVATIWLWVELRMTAEGIPTELWWVALGAAFGPGVIFTFVYVRIDSNALYHRMIRDAALIGEPGGSESGSE